MMHMKEEEELKFYHHEAEKVRKGSKTQKNCPFRASRGKKTMLGAQVSSLGTGGVISAALSHQICGNLLLQPQRINAIKKASELKSNLGRNLEAPQLLFCLF